MFTLKHSVALYVPATINIRTQIDNSSLVRELAHTLASEFGGCHLESDGSTGFYISNEGELVAESTKVLRAFCEDAESAKTFIFGLAGDLCVEMGQESVLVAVDGIAYFVDSKGE